MAQVEPAPFGGYGRQSQSSSGDTSRGGLLNLTFSSRCPPDIQPNTRIIALCGITDFIGHVPVSPSSSESDTPTSTSRPAEKTGMASIMTKGRDLLSPSKRKERKLRKKAKRSSKAPVGLASPEKDGWFFSDFYLFHHLFRGLGANQLWMTSESPPELVERYGAYGHGESKGDHRVVLDATLLPDIMHAGNIRVFQRGQLLQDFLRTLKDECTMAAALGQPILLMIFGHGDPKTYGIAIGGAGTPRKAPRLHTQHITACLRGIKVPLTMMLTSCFSGGWVLQPELNISALTAAGARVVSEAWPPSLGGRSHGSIFATAVRLAFTKLEDERATQIHPHPSGQEFDEERMSSTYAELTNTIHSTLLHDVDRLGYLHQIHFAAQNDEWEFEWRKRSGIPLARFQEQWTKLPVMAAQDGDGRGHGKTGGVDMRSWSLSEGEQQAIEGPHGLHRKLNEDQSISAIRDMACGYLNGFPGKGNAANNKSCHDDARDILEGKELATWQLQELQGALTYRIGSSRLASEYKDLLGLPFADCDGFNFESWQETVLLAIKPPASSDPKWTTYNKFRDMIDDAEIFDPPLIHQGWTYTKPYQYLAVACLESGLNVEDVKKAVATMLAAKAAQVEALTLRIRTYKTVRTVGSKAFSSLGKRLRSASPPRKRAPRPSFSEVVRQ